MGRPNTEQKLDMARGQETTVTSFALHCFALPLMYFLSNLPHADILHVRHFRMTSLALSLLKPQKGVPPKEIPANEGVFRLRTSHNSVCWIGHEDGPCCLSERISEGPTQPRRCDRRKLIGFAFGALLVCLFVCLFVCLTVGWLFVCLSVFLLLYII